MTAHEIIIRPIVTERSYSNMEENKYTFEVARNANKYQIKDAAGTLEPLGTGDLDEDLDAYFEANTATEQEVQEMLDEIFGSESNGG